MLLSFYKTRLYDPTTGSFIQPDIVGGGNKYAYTNNNPINFNDPSGHDTCDEENNCYDRWGHKYTGSRKGLDYPEPEPLPKPPDPSPSDLWTPPEPSSKGPCWGSWDCGDFDPRYYLPDYIAYSLTTGTFVYSYILDRYGNSYIALGIVLLPFPNIDWSGNYVIGNLDNWAYDDLLPTEGQLQKFIEGPYINGGLGVVWGAGSSYNIESTEMSGENGMYLPPNAALSINYACKIDNSFGSCMKSIPNKLADSILGIESWLKK